MDPGIIPDTVILEGDPPYKIGSEVIVKSEILVKSYQILNSKNLNNDDIFKIIEFIDKNYIK